MRNNTKQVMILDNFSSPYIHQAILILKDYNPALEDKVIEEAERVVSEYLNKPHIAVKCRKINMRPIVYILCGIAAAAAILSYII